ncbi:MAG: hypothetical protein PHQ40_17940 [Anaerolineaceae bacterium]|nr:hypothetical protein [Anaerolineaceae bacterium]
MLDDHLGNTAGRAVIPGDWRVPYLAGASNDGNRVYIDARVPPQYHKFLATHELTEHGLMEGPAKLPYEQAHKIATAAERNAVEAAGIDWNEYERVMDGYIKASEQEPAAEVERHVPADLYKKPYEHTRLLHEVEPPTTVEKVKKPTPKRIIKDAIESGDFENLRSAADAGGVEIAYSSKEEPIIVDEHLDLGEGVDVVVGQEWTNNKAWTWTVTELSTGNSLNEEVGSKKAAIASAKVRLGMVGLTLAEVVKRNKKHPGQEELRRRFEEKHGVLPSLPTPAVESSNPTGFRNAQDWVDRWAAALKIAKPSIVEAEDGQGQASYNVPTQTISLSPALVNYLASDNDRVALYGIEVLAHEFGHHIAESELAGANEKIQAAVDQDYRRWRESVQGKAVGDILSSRMTPSRATLESGMGLSAEYALDRHEWLADNAARWLLKQELQGVEAPESKALIARIAAKMKALWTTLSKHLVSAPSMEEFMQHLVDRNDARMAGQPMFSVPQAQARPLETFATPEEALNHLATNLGDGVRRLPLELAHGKAGWEEAVRGASNDPEWIAAQLDELARHPDAEEMTLGGKIYFDLNAIAKDRLVPVAIHSVGEHYNLERMLGMKAYADLQNQIASRAKIPNSLEEKIWNQVLHDYVHLQEGSREFTAEVIAKLGERQPNAPWYRRLLAHIKAFLVRMGFARMARAMTGEDMHALLVASLQSAARRDKAGVHLAGPAYSLAAKDVKSVVSLDHPRLDSDAPVRQLTAFLQNHLRSDNAVIKYLTEFADANGRQFQDFIATWFNKAISVERWSDTAQNVLGNLPTREDEFMAMNGYTNSTIQNDPWKELKRYESLVMDLSEKFRLEEWQPFLKKLNKYKISQQMMGDYLWAQNARDRNEKIRKINAEIQDGGSGLTDAEADTILSGGEVILPSGRKIQFSPEERAHMEELGGLYDAINAKTRVLAVALGLLPEQVKEYWEATEPHYAPLFRDFEEGDDLFHAMNASPGFSVRGGVSHRALGSEREAVNILANTELLRQRIIKRGVKAKGVGQTVFSLAVAAPAPKYYIAVDPQANPIVYLPGKVPDDGNPRSVAYYNRSLPLIEQAFLQGGEGRAPVSPLEWANILHKAPVDAQGRPILGYLRLFRTLLTEKPGTRRALTIAEAQEAVNALPVKDGVTQIPNLYDKFANLVGQTMEMGNSISDAVTGYVTEIGTAQLVNGKVVYRINPKLRDDKSVFATLIDGQAKYVFFNKRNEEAARIAIALNNLDAPRLGNAMAMAGKATRFVASMNTQYSPFFGPVNLIRDTQFAYLRTMDQPWSNYLQLLKYTGQSVKTLLGVMRIENQGGIYEPKTEVERAVYEKWREARAVGMPVGFTQLLGGSQEHHLEIEDAMQKLKIMEENAWYKSPRKLGYLIAQFVSDWNSVLEASVRLAVYRQAREYGVNALDAAIWGKDATVDFNQKGRIAAYVAPIYAFFNASAQGTYGFYKAVTGPAGRNIITGGLALGAVQAFMMAMAGYDDDDPPEVVRQRSLIFPIPWTGKDKPSYISIPMPLGFNAIPNVTRILFQAMLSKDKQQGAKPMFNLMGLMTDAANPFGGGPLLQVMSPTLLDPFAALVQNKNWQGMPIYREDFNSLDLTPAYTRAKPGANPITVWVSKQLNELPLLSDGTAYKPGMINVSPDALDYIIAQYAGGPGRELVRTAKLINAAITGETVPMYQVPGLGKFFGKAGEEAGIASIYYKNISALNMDQRELAGLRKDHPEKVGEYLRDNPQARLAAAGDATYRVIQDMNRRRRQLLDSGASREEIRNLTDRITEKMNLFNQRVDELRGP